MLSFILLAKLGLTETRNLATENHQNYGKYMIIPTGSLLKQLHFLSSSHN